MPFKNFRVYVGDTSPRVRECLRLLQNHCGLFLFRGTRHERRDVLSYDVLSPHQLQSVPPGLDLSFMNDTGVAPERLVDAVQNPEHFLSNGCNLLNQQEVKIVGSCPIDAGGSADVWAGEMNGSAVAIKSYRRNASSSCLPVYWVSSDCPTTNVFGILKVNVEAVQGSDDMDLSQQPRFRELHVFPWGVFDS